MTGDLMRGYGMLMGVQFPSGIWDTEGLCPSQEHFGALPLVMVCFGL